MNIQKYMRNTGLSMRVKWICISLFVILVLLLIFDAGIAIGSRRALQFHGPGMMDRGPQIGFGGWGMDMPHGFVPRGHGAVGTITSISLPVLTVQGREGQEQEVVLYKDTRIQGATSSVLQTQLHVGQEVVILGDPDDSTSAGQLKAELIRILPPPPQY